MGGRSRTVLWAWSSLAIWSTTASLSEAAVPLASFQSLNANAERIVETLEMLGTPLPAPTRQTLAAAEQACDSQALEAALDRHCSFVVTLDPAAGVSLAQGMHGLFLQQAGYVPVVVKIVNPAGSRRPIVWKSPQLGAVYGGEMEHSLKRQGQLSLKSDLKERAAPERILDFAWFTEQPMTDLPRGSAVEYAVALVYCVTAGAVRFDLQAASAAEADRPEVVSTPLSASALVAVGVPVRLRVRDVDGRPTMGRFTFRDAQGHVYPPQAKRLAPDFFFQSQIYRRDGETVLLPPGKLTVEYDRGPEYQRLKREMTVPRPTAPSSAAEATPPELSFDLRRWIDPQAAGYYSGDHHIHAAGCAHYALPTQGVHADDMFRQVKGEGLNVGSVLTWGPCFEYQRQFFGPEVSPLSEPLTLLKYDVEVSGFGSAALGHICLLNLRDHDYPGAEGTKLKGWPTWTVPALRWAKEQGGVTGYPHSASGMAIDPETATARLVAALDRDADVRLSREEAAAALLPEPFATIDRDRDDRLGEAELTASHRRAADQLPNYAVSESSLEICVSAALGVCDFISAMDTERIQEWNTWYHLMNCGLPIACAGETDFPCMSSTRVGQGRTYVRLGKIDDFTYSAWCRGLADGRSYVSDGYAHAPDFTVDGRGYGEQVELAAPGRAIVRARVAFSSQTPDGVPYGTVPATGLRHVGDTRTVYPDDIRPIPRERLVEIVVNGQVVAGRMLPADGEIHDLDCEVPIKRSSWIAVRQFPQLHTNPIRVLVAGKPIRASRRSAQWCLATIEQLERARGKFIAPAERAAAAAAYEEAKAYYRRVATESDVD